MIGPTIHRIPLWQPPHSAAQRLLNDSVGSDTILIGGSCYAAVSLLDATSRYGLVPNARIYNALCAATIQNTTLPRPIAPSQLS